MKVSSWYVPAAIFNACMRGGHHNKPAKVKNWYKPFVSDFWRFYPNGFINNSQENITKFTLFIPADSPPSFFSDPFTWPVVAFGKQLLFNKEVTRRFASKPSPPQVVSSLFSPLVVSPPHHRRFAPNNNFSPSHFAHTTLTWSFWSPLFLHTHAYFSEFYSQRRICFPSLWF